MLCESAGVGRPGVDISGLRAEANSLQPLMSRWWEFVFCKHDTVSESSMFNSTARSRTLSEQSD